MIVIKGRKITFTHKHFRYLRSMSQHYGLTMRDTFTGLLWEHIMQKAREGVFLREKKTAKKS